MTGTTVAGEITVEVEVGAGRVTLSSGRLAKQADGAVLARSGDTVVLATAVGRTEAREGTDFFPLTVDIEEKMYAAGKIPGGFFKREGKASEKATLNARMIDRPIRPLFPKGFRNEVQVIGTVLSVDMVNAHDILAINAASAALTVSSLPFAGPVGAVRIGLLDGELVVNPALEEQKLSDLDLIVCGTADAITMVEAGAREVPEDTLIEALALAHAEIKKLCDAQVELARQVGKPKWVDAAVNAEMASRYGARIDALVAEQGLAGVAAGGRRGDSRRARPQITDPTRPRTTIVRRTQVRWALQFLADERRAAAVKAVVAAQFGEQIKGLSDAEQDSKELKSAKRDALVEQILATIALPFPGGAADGGIDAATRTAIKSAVEAVYKGIVRTKIAVEKRRPDGRSADGDPPDLDRGRRDAAHARLGPLHARPDAGADARHARHAKEEQRIDDLSLESNRYYMHHYNFPPFSVGETGFMRGPKRRDIGHGALAERALLAVIPSDDEFAYTIRAVSEILESNGSSSMASVCGSTLALMDAGVPIKAPVAGIAMGLIKEGDSLRHPHGHPGRRGSPRGHGLQGRGHRCKGLTALQMDIKITGGPQELLRDALSRARDARLSILAPMAETLAEPRASLAAHAPQVLTTSIAPEQIGLLIGKGGETIRGLEEEYTVQIDIEEDGTVRIYGAGDGAGNCKEHIEQMMRPVQPGDVYREKRVVKIADFGAFVELRKGTDGLLHVSRIAPGVRIQSTDQVLDRNDIVSVEVVEVDQDRGRIALKLIAKHEDGVEITPEALGERYVEAHPDAARGAGRPDGDRPDRGPREGGDGGGRRRRGPRPGGDR